MASVATSIIFEEQIEVPLTMRSLADFRRWALSDEFPETGRIDFIEGKIEVDMAPEDFFCHGGVKTEFAGCFASRKETGLGICKSIETHLLSRRPTYPSSRILS